MKIYTGEMRMQLALIRGIIVDEQDAWLLSAYTWHVGSHGYAQTMVQGTMTKLHHCIMGQPIWDTDEIDHKNRNRLYNSRSNLRYSSSAEQKHNTSRVIDAANVYPVPRGYQVKITRFGETYMKFFRTEQEAIAARGAWLALQEK